MRLHCFYGQYGTWRLFQSFGTAPSERTQAKSTYSTLTAPKKIAMPTYVDQRDGITVGHVVTGVLAQKKKRENNYLWWQKIWITQINCIFKAYCTETHKVAFEGSPDCARRLRAAGVFRRWGDFPQPERDLGSGTLINLLQEVSFILRTESTTAVFATALSFGQIRI